MADGNYARLCVGGATFVALVPRGKHGGARPGAGRKKGALLPKVVRQPKFCCECGKPLPAQRGNVRRCLACRGPRQLTKPPTSECLGCGNTIVQGRGKGPAKKYCSEQCNPWLSREPRQSKTCGYWQCGKAFQSVGKMVYCGASCRVEASKLLAQARWKQKVKPLLVLNCSSCGTEFKQSRHDSMYCSKQCKRIAYLRRNGIEAQAEEKRRAREAARAALSLQKAEEQKRKSEARLAKVEARQAALAAKAALRLCSYCHKAVGPRRKKFCGDCVVKHNREQKRLDKHVRRAITRGGTAEAVLRKQIFDRDGWRCQICGIATPERLIGSNKPNEPTQDHIIAVSRGGNHTAENLQCACRRCNTKKGASAPIGQMGLLGVMHQGGAGMRGFAGQ